eukprot:CAMPEP_0114227436 /NCGR_PEP_ID=MMETSP0058-20121206/1790_1 /TAXON_ID=36894 /ORGANISM="Pyramimonas parkeae, CCMP726" /LENGTH=298 /DNA_ID=CAMNT_0001338279 /DNA_START=253 /DNA_END=1149 /DNA_ORIENTATION=+
MCIAQQLPRRIARRRAAQDEFGIVSEGDDGMQDPTDLAGITVVLPSLRERLARAIGDNTPHVCHRAESECKHHKSCLLHKYQAIPSCGRAKSRCMQLPVGDQAIMPFCQSCLDAGRDIRGCQPEAVQCTNTKEICYKIRQRVRLNECAAAYPKIGLHWSVPALRDAVKSVNTTDECAGAILAEISAFEDVTAATMLTWTKNERKERAEVQRKMELQRMAHNKAAAKMHTVAIASSNNPRPEKVVVGVQNSAGKTQFVAKTALSKAKQIEAQEMSRAEGGEGVPERMSYPVLDFSLDVE